MKALITGASSGIGREIAIRLAQRGYDLIIVARNRKKLENLKSSIKNVNVRIIVLDLSEEKNCFELYQLTKDENIDFLVNNAGFGAYGKFNDVPLERELSLIKTNVIALHILTKLYLKDMIKRNSGYILNVGSAAGFLSGPRFSSYYASKNYVVRLTQAIHEELRRDKIKVGVSVLCPGPVNTEFNNIADVKFCINGLDAGFVADYAIEQTLKNKSIITPGLRMKAVKFFQHFVSEEALTRISYNVQLKKSGNENARGDLNEAQSSNKGKATI